MRLNPQYRLSSTIEEDAEKLAKYRLLCSLLRQEGALSNNPWAATKLADYLLLSLRKITLR